MISTGVDGHGTLIAGVVAQFVPQATIDPVDIFNPFQTLTGTTGATTGGVGGIGGVGVPLATNSNAATSSQNVYNGIQYVADHPYVNDPIRPGKVDRVIAATFGFGSQTTFSSERTAYNQFPQLVISLKNQLHRYRKLGIAPIAAAGQYGNPKGDSTGSGATGATTATTTGTFGANNAGNTNVGDSNGMSLPAALNEVISVTGVIPFPFVQTPASSPIDTPIGVTPSPGQPVLITAGTTGTTGTTASSTNSSPLSSLLLGNTQPTPSTGTTATTTATGTFIDGIPQGLYTDRILASANRSATTDFAAPAVDIPTFRRTFNLATTTTTTATTATTTDPLDHLTFTEGGTSLAAGIVAGSYALVSSALNYWTALNQTGVTSDAYLNGPVGQTTLNFGPHAFKNLSAYNNPDGINAILAWTSVPAADPNDGLSQSQPPYLFGTQSPRSFARVDVGNAIAAIEGTEAIKYLLQHNDFTLMDTNHNGIITAQELQTFVDNASAMGLPEAGAMARLLGGTDSTTRRPPLHPRRAAGPIGCTAAPLQLLRLRGRRPAQWQRHDRPVQDARAHPAPLPDAYVITDRQRLGQRLPARSGRGAQLPRPAAPPAAVRVRSQERSVEVPQYLAKPVRDQSPRAQRRFPRQPVPDLDPVLRRGCSVEYHYNPDPDRHAVDKHLRYQPGRRQHGHWINQGDPGSRPDHDGFHNGKPQCHREHEHGFNHVHGQLPGSHDKPQRHREHEYRFNRLHGQLPGG